MLSLTAGDAARPGLLGYIKGLRFIRIEAFDTDAAVTATGLLRFGHSWAAVLVAIKGLRLNERQRATRFTRAAQPPEPASPPSPHDGSEHGRGLAYA